MQELMKVNCENERITLSGRELHDFLEVESNYTTWFKRMIEYGFAEDIDYQTCFPNLESENHGGQNKQDHQLTIDMAKEIAMVQRSEKGKQARTYFIELEKQWNSPESVMARALKMADNKIYSLQNNIKSLETENKLLAQETLTWADRKVIEAVVKKIGGKIGYSDAWREFKKELLYKHGININSRITNHLNESGKKTQPKTLDMVHNEELQACISTAVALAKNKNVDIKDIISKFDKTA